MIVRTVTVTGFLGADEVGLNITAGTDAPGHVLKQMVDMAAKAVEHKWPGVQEVRQRGEWKTIDVPDTEAYVTFEDDE